jgi:uncharacterized protein with NRDE domain
MCTVTFLPLKEGFILTSNRDEWVVRESAVPPQKYVVENHPVFFPKDQKAGGTWIVAGENYTLCLLNGAFEKHTPKPPYKKSRGLMVLDFFQFNSSEDFISQYDFSGIENFTLIIVDHRKKINLTELRWDGIKSHVTPKPEQQTHIWSSSTLYTDEIISERKHWFENWLHIHPEFKQEEIIHFHHFGGKGDTTNDILMNRNDQVKTVSITSVKRTASDNLVHYFDLQKNEKFELPIFVNNNVSNKR